MGVQKLLYNINGAERLIVCDPEDSLAKVLRGLGLTGTKIGCGTGVCGACSVLVDGEVVRACVKKVKNVPEHSKILTIEGIGTPTNLHPIQLAMIVKGGVQCGFCTPGFIVSAKGLLDTNLNPTREEVRDWFQKHRNLCRCTGYKPIVDAVMEAAKVLRGELTMQELEFKIPEDGRIYGTHYPRPAALAKVCGTCDYGTDINEKMGADAAFHLGLAQAKVSRARVLDIDISEAEKVPGVIKVVTYKDIKGTNRLFAGSVPTRTTCDGFDRPLLVEDMVRQYGDTYAIVIARTRKIAREAADKVKVTLERLPEYMNALDAVAENAEEIYDGRENIYAMQPVIKGENTEEIINSSPYVVQESYHSQRQPHIALEPDTMLAYKDENGKWAIQCKSLALLFIPFMAAGAIGVDLDDIRPIENPTGASFGYSVSPNNYALALAATISVDGFPVCLDMDYAQHTYTTGKRSESYTNITMAGNEEGKITAMEFEILYDKGAYSDTAGVLVQKGVRFMGFPYSIPNVKGVSMLTCSDHAFSTAFRGFGSPQAYTASEQALDELAYKMGMDPFEIRYRNILRPGDTTNTGNTLSVYPMVGLMDKIRPKYEEAVARAKKESTEEKRRGVGIVCGGYNVTGDPDDFSMVDLELNPDGSVTVYNSWEDQGQGGDIGSLVLAHEALKPLGIEPKQIKLIQNDMGICPPTGPASASRSHYMAGNATIDAANQLMEAMKKEDGTYRTYAEMKAEGIETRYNGMYTTTGQCTYIDPNDGQGDPTPEYTYAVFMSEVEVDMKTGKTKVLKYTTCTDIGPIGSMQAVEGQALGGAAQCIGFALSENYQDPAKDTNPVRLGIPNIKDVPDDLELIFQVTKRPTGPFGSGGCAESFLSSGHISVINAIYNATGVRIRELPATASKVLSGIEALEKGETQKSKPYFLGMDFEERMAWIAERPLQGE